MLQQLSFLLLIFCDSFPGSEDLFFWAHVLHSQMFYAIFYFPAWVEFETLDGNRAPEERKLLSIWIHCFLSTSADICSFFIVFLRSLNSVKMIPFAQINENDYKLCIIHARPIVGDINKVFHMLSKIRDVFKNFPSASHYKSLSFQLPKTLLNGQNTQKFTICSWKWWNINTPLIINSLNFD